MSWFLDRLRLDGEALDARVENAVTAGEHLRTMKGASTVELTIHDPDRTLLRTGVLVKKRKKERRNEPIRPASNLRIGETRLALDGDPYLLASYSKSGQNLVLRFEHEITALMRRYTKPRKASRSTYSRAQFILHFLVRPVRERFIRTHFESFGAQAAYAPGDNPDTKHKVERLNQVHVRRGTAGGGNITVNGSAPDKDQQRNIARELEVAVELNAPEKAKLALLCAGIHESHFYTGIINGQNKPGDPVPASSSGAKGVFQILPSNWGTVNWNDVDLGTRIFLNVGFGNMQAGGAAVRAQAKSPGPGGAIRLATAHPDWTPGTIAEQVEGSGVGGQPYDAHLPEAKLILESSGTTSGGSLAGDTTTINVPQRYIFHVGSLNGQREDYWEGGVRLAEEVNAEFFVANNVLTYGFDRDFFPRPAVAMVAEAPTPQQRAMGVQYVGNIDFEQFIRHAVEEVRFTARANQFFAFPGATIEIVDPNLGPAVGKYLISEIRDTLGSFDVEIVCSRPVAQRKEPAAPTTSITIPAQYGAQQSRGTSRKLVYPLPVHGTDLGGVAAHNGKPGQINYLWQSVNAVDIGVPRGTRVFCVDDGTITGLGGHWDGTGQSNPNGFNFTLRTETNEWFYTHMMSRVPNLTIGQSMSRGDPIGVTGAANGVDHLHIASIKGDPEALLGV